MKKVYIITNENEESEKVVRLSPDAAKAIENFIEWAEIEDTYSIRLFDSFTPEEWGDKA